MKKHKVTAMIAFGILVLAVVAGVWALNSNGGPQKSTAGKASSAAPDAAATSPATNGDKGADLVVPKGVVDPTTGKNYCATAKLLAIYARQSYGLDSKQQVVNGKKFDTRLKVIAATYARLADQAAAQPKAGDVAPHWQAMADATTAAEEKLRVTGLQVQSQEMIVQLSRLAKSVQDNLPTATRTLQATCGLSPAIFGI